MLYNYSDVIKLFDTIAKVVKQPGDHEYSEELSCYVSYNRVTEIIDHLVNGGLTIDDYIFVHKGIERMKKHKDFVFIGDIFHVADPIDLKNFYHQTVFHFGSKAAEMINDECLFGKAYCNAMKRCNKSSKYQDLVNIPDARSIFAELKKILVRKERDGYIITDEVRQYMK